MEAGETHRFAAMRTICKRPNSPVTFRLSSWMAANERLALMCAEAVPWRCHRSLIADALVLRGLRVEHVIGAQQRKRHVITPWARTDGLQIVYPPCNERLIDQRWAVTTA